MILGILGSGREGGNSARLLEEALQGAVETSGRPARTILLSRLSFRGCIGCLACRETSEVCVLSDGLAQALADTASASALVLAAPIYYGYPTGLFKSYLDRWYSFRSGDRGLRTPEGRQALLILAQGHPDPTAYRWATESLQKVLGGYGWVPSFLVAPGLEGAGAAARAPELLAEARQAGARLAGSGAASTR